MSTLKKALIGLGIVVVLILYLFIFNITESNDTKKDTETKQEIKLEEPAIAATDEIKNATFTEGKVQLNGAIITLPMKVDEFIAETGFDFSSTYMAEVNADTNLRPLKEGTAYLTSDGNNLITVKIRNTSEKRIKNSKNCYIYGIGITDTTQGLNKANSGLLYTAGGITHNTMFSDYKKYLNSLEWDKAVVTEANNKSVNYFLKDIYMVTYFYDLDTGIIKEIQMEIKQETKSEESTESVQETENIN